MKNLNDIKNRMAELDKVYRETGDSITARKYNALARMEDDILSIPVGYREYTFDSLQATPGNTTAIAAIENIDIKGGEFIFIYGTPGCGKSHLAVAGLQKQLITNNSRIKGSEHPSVRGRYIDLTDYFRLQRLKISGEKVSIPDLTKHDILVIDDIGKTKPTDWTYEEFYNLVEKRKANKKATIFVSNYDADTLKRRLSTNDAQDVAIVSRITSGKVFEIKGKDRRQG